MELPEGKDRQVFPSGSRKWAKPEIMTGALCCVKEATPDSKGHRFPVAGQQSRLYLRQDSTIQSFTSCHRKGCSCYKDSHYFMSTIQKSLLNGATSVRNMPLCDEQQSRAIGLHRWKISQTAHSPTDSCLVLFNVLLCTCSILEGSIATFLKYMGITGGCTNLLPPHSTHTQYLDTAQQSTWHKLHLKSALQIVLPGPGVTCYTHTHTNVCQPVVVVQNILKLLSAAHSVTCSQHWAPCEKHMAIGIITTVIAELGSSSINSIHFIISSEWTLCSVQIIH